jgi:hypothetical protein
MKMITYAEAKLIAEKEIADAERELGIPVAIRHAADREEDIGYIFFYNSVAALEDPNSNLNLAGNGPLLVLKDSGELINLPTCMPLEDGLEGVRRERGLS